MYQLLRRFHPELVSETLRAEVRNFIKHTNLDTFTCLARIYDFAVAMDPADTKAMWRFAGEMRERVDAASDALRDDGERLLDWMQRLYDERDRPREPEREPARVPYGPTEQPDHQHFPGMGVAEGGSAIDWLGLGGRPVPYDEFRRRMESR
jgi:hypothetical protein